MSKSITATLANSSIERISLEPAAWFNIARCAAMRAESEGVTYTGRTQFFIGNRVITNPERLAAEQASREVARAMAARAASL